MHVFSTLLQVRHANMPQSAQTSPDTDLYAYVRTRASTVSRLYGSDMLMATAYMIVEIDIMKRHMHLDMLPESR